MAETITAAFSYEYSNVSRRSWSTVPPNLAVVRHPATCAAASAQNSLLDASALATA